MASTFDDVWALPDGTWIQVSDGNPAPRLGSLHHKVWRSHNFAGPIYKHDTVEGGRQLEVEFASSALAHVCYVIHEDYPHQFTLLEDPYSS